MEQSLADLLSDAFAEASVPSFPEGDLDFENLNFDEKFEEDKTDICHEDLPTKEDGALHQEATGQTAVLSSMETKDIYMAENVDEEQSDEEDFQGVGVRSMGKIPEEDYTSSDGDSEQESSVSGEDEEDEGEDMGAGERPGDLLMSVRCADEFCDGDKEDMSLAEGQPLAPEGAENPQVRNEEQGESESDEEVAYFERVPERGSEMMITGDGIEEDEQEREEEKQEDSSDSVREGMKIEQEENVLARCLENPYGDGPVKVSLEFPEISKQNLQDLLAEVDSEEHVEKMKDFSGEEHQEAGESFAEYPSDFSSCEHEEDGGKNQESKHQSNASACTSDTRLERAATWMGRAEDADEEGDEYLYSVDLEVDADQFRNLDVATGGKDRGEREIKNGLDDISGSDGTSETDESDSYSSSDDDHNNRAGPPDFKITWNLDVLTTDTLLSEDLLTTEDTDKAETPLSDVSQRPAEDVDNSYSVVQRGDAKSTSPSNQGSLDDSFFFTEPEASGVTEQGQLGDDEYEEERNWEQEQERIKAFNEFYDDSDGEKEREGRQIKVQFCADPLSQVILYETDSSDRDSLSSSTDGEEDQSSAETSEELKEPDESTQMEPACDPPNTQLPEPVPDLMRDQSETQVCTRKHKCLNVLKVALKMGVVIMTGLVMFWLVTDKVDWLGGMSFF